MLSNKHDSDVSLTTIYFPKSTLVHLPTCSYSVVHNSIHPHDFSGNHSNHKNFVPSLVSHKLWLIWIGMKQKKYKIMRNTVRQYSIMSCQFFEKNDISCSYFNNVYWLICLKYLIRKAIWHVSKFELGQTAAWK